MGNSASSISFTYKVNFSRETPNDFYVSGDRVQGIIQIVTNDNENDLNSKYGPVYVELIGQLHDFTPNRYHDRYGERIEIFFQKKAQVIKLPKDNPQLEDGYFQSYKYAFDGLLDSLLPSSLPPDTDGDPCICYYARVYLRHTDLIRKFAFLVFTRTPMPLVIQQSLQNHSIEASARHKDVKLHGTLPNNGLIVPGRNLMFQIEIDNPTNVTIKSIRATLKQYRIIINAETNFTIFSTLLPGFKSKGFNNEYRQSTYEIPIPLEKCRVMAPTSIYKNVRYELDIQCYLNCSFNNHFTLTLPIICTTDHQQPIKVMEELKSLPKLHQRLLHRKEEKPPPKYEDFMASEILPKYQDIFH